MLRRDNGKENIVESANVLTDVNVSNKFMPCFKSREDMVTERISMPHQKFLKCIFSFAKLCQVFVLNATHFQSFVTSLQLANQVLL